MALWSGRFEQSVSEFTQRFGASLPVDKRMYKQDIAGSIAHARMLGRQGILRGQRRRSRAAYRRGRHPTERAHAQHVGGGAHGRLDLVGGLAAQGGGRDDGDHEALGPRAAGRAVGRGGGGLRTGRAGPRRRLPGVPPGAGRGAHTSPIHDHRVGMTSTRTVVLCG